jgi:Mn-dependent DtxR family transcriptional regulator
MYPCRKIRSREDYHDCYYLRKKKDGVTIRQMANDLKLNLRTVHNTVKALAGVLWVDMKKMGVMKSSQEL